MTALVTTTPAVSIKNLKIALPKGAERPYAVDGISLDLITVLGMNLIGEGLNDALNPRLAKEGR